MYVHIYMYMHIYAKRYVLGVSLKIHDMHVSTYVGTYTYIFLRACVCVYAC